MHVLHHHVLLLSALTTALPLLAPRQSFSIPGLGGTSTANDVTSGACKPVTYIFARGTTEMGNMGSTVGPALQAKLASALGGSDQLATQGVDYPADVAGTVVGSMSPGQAQGSQKCAQLVKTAVRNCPQTKVVLAGYSQGAQQVHGCLIDLGADGAKSVAAAVTFGDPLKAQAFKNIDTARTKIFCATGDLVCTDQFIITPAHLSYASGSTGPAAEFIKQQIGSLDSSSTSSSTASPAPNGSATVMSAALASGSSTTSSSDSSSSDSSSSSGLGSGMPSGLSGLGGLGSLIGGGDSSSSSGGSSLLSGLSGLGGGSSSGDSGASSMLGGLGGSSSGGSGSGLMSGLSGLGSGMGGLSGLSGLSGLGGLGGSKN